MRGVEAAPELVLACIEFVLRISCLHAQSKRVFLLNFWLRQTIPGPGSHTESGMQPDSGRPVSATGYTCANMMF